jgi:hypothetical protein
VISYLLEGDQRYLKTLESDAKTHRTPKALSCKIHEGRELFRVSFGVRTRPRVAFAMEARCYASGV